MTVIKPAFNISNFEIYGYTDPYLTPEQLNSVQQVETRVSSQLDWLAQLLGWNGPDYWFNLVSNINQKRQLLTGSFGVYDGFIYPEIKEIRNWDNTVHVKADTRIKVGQTFYLGDYSYKLQGIQSVNDTYILSFGNLPDQFYSDIASNEQLKVDAQGARPAPFNRPTAMGSADVFLSVSLNDVDNSLSLSFKPNPDHNLPVVHNNFFSGSRAYFDMPLQLLIPNESDPGSPLIVNPVYDFTVKGWYLDVPSEYTDIEALLQYETYTLKVQLIAWQFDGGWNSTDVLNNFRGVWANKGGKLPFNFVFDSLSVHGFSESKSVTLDAIETTFSFNELLDLIYYQKAVMSALPPPVESAKNQIWYNTQTGSLAVYNGQNFNCGPWVEIQYPESPEMEITPGYVFMDVASFLSYPDSIPPNTIVRILDAQGLSDSDNIYGLTGTISPLCSIDIYFDDQMQYWVIYQLFYDSVADFNLDALILPGKTMIRIEDSFGLEPQSLNYSVKNLYTTLSENYPVLISKDPTPGVNEWYIAPPSRLKYIGDTKLYDLDGPVNGEMYWDYNQPAENFRAGAVFYYNQWQYVVDHWELQGEWYPINGYTFLSLPPSPTVEYGVLKVFCDGNLLTDGQSFQTYDYQIKYESSAGTISFTYKPITFNGSVNLPQIILTDSLTTTYRYDITDMVFSGLNYRLNPNPADTNTPLRVWKTDPLYAIESLEEVEENRYSNPMVADENTGPADDNWEKYFLRLSPLYERNSNQWQKVNLICQDFGLWGTPLSPEEMRGPQQDEEPSIYEDVFLFNRYSQDFPCMYSEPYLYSNINYGKGEAEDYDNSNITPGFDVPGDGFDEADLKSYDPLHNRQVFTERKSKIFGNWKGMYVKADPCSVLSGFLVKDLEDGAVNNIQPPTWDYSIYKLPPINHMGSLSSKVDANHYKIGYAFFTADLSAAEEAAFDIGSVG